MVTQHAQNLEEDFARLRAKLSDPMFLANKGIGNEVGFFVFPYDAAREDEVRARTAELVSLSNEGKLPCCIVHRDLWDVFLQICEQRRILDKIADLELRRGSRALLERLQKIATPEAFVQAMDYAPHEPGRDVLLVTGVGRVYPIVRAHSILENAQHVFADVPVVLLYPGKYDGSQLHLFNSISDGNYYRAFNLL
ncbi:MAG TPA: DUF1788 domain-containing protein [Candidatus Olsenella stercoravium]|uniref:DUF1788 domain-containing protein n=1 Tax=Candidatus Olsenella stercoravium TaxID=2838713 RepID=A0A9D2IQ79_9ACTN|nr:DUF1788 domain-containing protein [Candidatus Olsenella stercoravium]